MNKVSITYIKIKNIADKYRLNPRFLEDIFRDAMKYSDLKEVDNGFLIKLNIQRNLEGIFDQLSNNESVDDKVSILRLDFAEQEDDEIVWDALEEIIPSEDNYVMLSFKDYKNIYNYQNNNNFDNDFLIEAKKCINKHTNMSPKNMLNLFD